MQYGLKRISHFSTIWLDKNDNKIKHEPVGVFNSVFSYGKLRDSSLTYFLGFAVLFPEIIENIGQMHKSAFSF